MADVFYFMSFEEVGLDPVRDRIVDVQRLHDVVKEFREEMVQWRLGNLGRIERHQ
jgi:hypothetical protein